MKINNCKQYSEQWWECRNGKPSASNASKLITSTGAASKQLKDYAIDLANAIYSGVSVDQFAGNAHTDRGTELEPLARSSYELITGYDVQEVGMFTDDHDRYIASPDGVIEDGNGLLEIKNLAGKNHTKVLIYYSKYGRIPTDHVAQIQMQLFVSKRKWVDLYYHHPDLPCLKVTIEPDLAMHRALEMQLAAVISERDRIVNILKEF